MQPLSCSPGQGQTQASEKNSSCWAGLASGAPAKSVQSFASSLQGLWSVQAADMHVCNGPKPLHAEHARPLCGRAQRSRASRLLCRCQQAGWILHKLRQSKYVEAGYAAEPQPHRSCGRRCAARYSGPTLDPDRAGLSQAMRVC